MNFLSRLFGRKPPSPPKEVPMFSVWIEKHVHRDAPPFYNVRYQAEDGYPRSCTDDYPVASLEEARRLMQFEVDLYTGKVKLYEPPEIVDRIDLKLREHDGK